MFSKITERLRACKSSASVCYGAFIGRVEDIIIHSTMFLWYRVSDLDGNSGVLTFMLARPAGKYDLVAQ